MDSSENIHYVYTTVLNFTSHAENPCYTRDQLYSEAIQKWNANDVHPLKVSAIQALEKTDQILRGVSFETFSFIMELLPPPKSFNIWNVCPFEIDVKRHNNLVQRYEDKIQRLDSTVRQMERQNSMLEAKMLSYEKRWIETERVQIKLSQVHSKETQSEEFDLKDSVIEDQRRQIDLLLSKIEASNKAEQKYRDDFEKTYKNLEESRSKIGMLQQTITRIERASKEKMTFRCPFCKHDHDARDCQVYPTPEARLYRAETLGLCLRCLTFKHKTINCEKRDKCVVEGCHAKHHPLLHWDTSSTSRFENRMKRICAVYKSLTEHGCSVLPCSHIRAFFD